MAPPNQPSRYRASRRTTRDWEAFEAAGRQMRRALMALEGHPTHRRPQVRFETALQRLRKASEGWNHFSLAIELHALVEEAPLNVEQLRAALGELKVCCAAYRANRVAPMGRPWKASEPELLSACRWLLRHLGEEALAPRLAEVVQAHREGRPPRPGRIRAWARLAAEQNEYEEAEARSAAGQLGRLAAASADEDFLREFGPPPRRRN